MNNTVFDYVINSTDETQYNKIKCTLQGPISTYSRMIVTTLSTKSNFLVLQSGDHITFNNSITYTFTTDYSNIDSNTFIRLFNKLISTENITRLDNKINIVAGIDNTERITLYSPTSFKITYMSYNLKLLFGLYNNEFNSSSSLESTKCPAITSATPSADAITTIQKNE